MLVTLTSKKREEIIESCKGFFFDVSMHTWVHTLKECQQKDHGLTQK